MAKLKKAKNKKIVITKIALFAVFALVFSGVFLFEKQIYAYVNQYDFATYDKIVQSDLLVHFIDVGQGDAIAIKLPDNKTMLIDSGTGSSSDELISYLQTSFFAANENTFDYFLITHPHEDHIGASPEIFEKFQVNQFLRPEVYTPAELDELAQIYGTAYIEDFVSYDTQIFHSLITSAKNEPDCTIEFFSYLNSPINLIGQDYTLDIYTFVNQDQEMNNYSPMIVLQSHGKKFIFTGDAETEVEQEMLAYSNIINADVLKVGHHGSTTSSSIDFLNAVTPAIAIISVGDKNTYGHPTQTILDRLSMVGSNTYRTDESGNILIGFDENNALIIFTTKTSNLPVKIEVWQIYLVGCGLVFYFIFVFNPKKNKLKY